MLIRYYNANFYVRIFFFGVYSEQGKEWTKYPTLEYMFLSTYGDMGLQFQLLENVKKSYSLYLIFFLLKDCVINLT